MVKKVATRLRLDFKKGKKKVPTNKKSQAINEVGDYILNRINKSLTKQESPVTGRKFVPLSKDYAAVKKGKGKGTKANLFLDGDMRSQIIYSPFRDGVDVGIFDEDEANKADNHNKNSAKSRKTKVPERPLIPKAKGAKHKQTFSKDIKEGIEDILKKYRR